jgi:hypothetical protein
MGKSAMAKNLRDLFEDIERIQRDRNMALAMARALADNVWLSLERSNHAAFLLIEGFQPDAISRLADEALRNAIRIRQERSNV